MTIIKKLGWLKELEKRLEKYYGDLPHLSEETDIVEGEINGVKINLTLRILGTDICFEIEELKETKEISIQVEIGEDCFEELDETSFWKAMYFQK